MHVYNCPDSVTVAQGINTRVHLHGHHRFVYQPFPERTVRFYPGTLISSPNILHLFSVCGGFSQVCRGGDGEQVSGGSDDISAQPSSASLLITSSC